MPLKKRHFGPHLLDPSNIYEKPNSTSSPYALYDDFIFGYTQSHNTIIKYKQTRKMKFNGMAGVEMETDIEWSNFFFFYFLFSGVFNFFGLGELQLTSASMT